MELIEEYPERFTFERLSKDYYDRFGFFSQFCLGGVAPYISEHPAGLKLTQEGSRELNNLKQRLMGLELQKEQVEFNKYLLTATIVIAMIGFYQIKESIFNTLLTSKDTAGIISIVIGGMILFLLFWLIYRLMKR